jgi:Holliday junction resolvase RusA-like endonuclease
LKLSFTIPGAPVPKARARKGRGGHWYTPEKTRNYEMRIAVHARQTLAVSGFRSQWPMDADYMLRARIYVPTRRRLDVDNVCKSLADGMIGMLWDDDHRVGIECPPWDVDKTNPRVEVTVEVIAAKAGAA